MEFSSSFDQILRRFELFPIWTNTVRNRFTTGTNSADKKFVWATLSTSKLTSYPVCRKFHQGKCIYLALFLCHMDCRDHSWISSIHLLHLWRNLVYSLFVFNKLPGLGIAKATASSKIIKVVVFMTKVLRKWKVESDFLRWIDIDPDHNSWLRKNILLPNP